MIELDYYPLAIAAKKTDYSEQLLICLAAEDKLSLYVRLGEHKGLEIGCYESEDENGRKREHWFCTNPCDEENNYIPLPLGLDPKKVPTYSIQAYQNNSNASLKDDLTEKGWQYDLIEPVPFKDITLLVSAEDVARLSKKHNVSETRSPLYEKRNNAFQAWINEVSPKHEDMTKDDIHKELIARDSRLFSSGFPDWWKQQPIYNGTAGRKKK